MVQTTNYLFFISITTAPTTSLLQGVSGFQSVAPNRIQCTTHSIGRRSRNAICQNNMLPGRGWWIKVESIDEFEGSLSDIYNDSKNDPSAGFTSLSDLQSSDNDKYDEFDVYTASFDEEELMDELDDYLDEEDDDSLWCQDLYSRINELSNGIGKRYAVRSGESVPIYSKPIEDDENIIYRLGGGMVVTSSCKKGEWIQHLEGWSRIASPSNHHPGLMHVEE